ncbi:hypothetical protein CDIK_3310 [Cucumispora dikerogammari]|nr:hypothetical protein CDIK_3310 [Cucumispora dikerogammari]
MIQIDTLLFICFLSFIITFSHNRDSEDAKNTEHSLRRCNSFSDNTSNADTILDKLPVETYRPYRTKSNIIVNDMIQETEICSSNCPIQTELFEVKTEYNTPNPTTCKDDYLFEYSDRERKEEKIISAGEPENNNEYIKGESDSYEKTMDCTDRIYIGSSGKLPSYSLPTTIYKTDQDEELQNYNHMADFTDDKTEFRDAKLDENITVLSPYEHPIKEVFANPLVSERTVPQQKKAHIRKRKRLPFSEYYDHAYSKKPVNKTDCVINTSNILDNMLKNMIFKPCLAENPGFDDITVGRKYEINYRKINKNETVSLLEAIKDANPGSKIPYIVVSSRIRTVDSISMSFIIYNLPKICFTWNFGMKKNITLVRHHGIHNELSFMKSYIFVFRFPSKISFFLEDLIPTLEYNFQPKTFSRYYLNKIEEMRTVMKVLYIRGSEIIIGPDIQYLTYIKNKTKIKQGCLRLKAFFEKLVKTQTGQTLLIKQIGVVEEFFLNFQNHLLNMGSITDESHCIELIMSIYNNLLFVQKTKLGINETEKLNSEERDMFAVYSDFSTKYINFTRTLIDIYNLYFRADDSQILSYS